MKRDDQLEQNVGRLIDIEVEYDMTIRVLAVMVERVQQLTGAPEVQISDAEVGNQPDLSAWRNVSENSISLHAAR